jgi:acylpyruvate hydrolase
VRLATVRLPGRTAAVRIEDGWATELGVSDVGTLLRQPDWRRRAAEVGGERHPGDHLDYAPLVPAPDKVVCVGLNYRQHILEMGHALPEHPTLFAKYRGALIGARDDIVQPRVSSFVDWEAELAVVLGAPVRHASAAEAEAAIAGYSVTNDVTARDFQARTAQWLQGKTFESSTPLGPELVTADEAGPVDALEVRCEVGGELMQQACAGDLVFGPVELVRYVSAIVRLLPGDVISTGTPAGVGQARTPPRSLGDGTLVVTGISGLGECRNRCRAEA